VILYSLLLGPLTDSSKEAPELRLPEGNKKDSKEDSKEEKSLPHKNLQILIFLYGGFCTNLCCPLPIIGHISG
jgi:hypothetical protein